MRGADDNAVHHDQQYFSFTQNRNNLHDCSTITLSIFHIEQFAIVHQISLGFYKPKVIK